MANFATVTLVGHLGKDPETRHTQGGDAVVSFAVATSVKARDREETTWWNCTAWGKRGETIAKHFRKGDPILIQGEPKLRKWRTDDGREGQSLEVTVQAFAFVGGKRDERAQEPRGGHDDSSGRNGGRPARERQEGPSVPRQGYSAPDFDDDIPFDLYQRGLAW